MAKHLKDPNAVFEFTLHAIRWLAGRTLTGCVWTITRTRGTGALTIAAESVVSPDAFVDLLGGDDGDVYDLSARLTASGGGQKDFSTEIRVRQTTTG